ncbi:hypothetical protein HYALB_00005221 [Hymenoscyphus albidus]|uniref:Uncharacterized protein n=1 Tax=Hymenoscyphus albidus TaxID=595503 RepID=A0A9N9Q8C9_9HELO|nr:hypothetical protein HYALB_00005221 [Hymenoscyphus albidus]
MSLPKRKALSTKSMITRHHSNLLRKSFKANRTARPTALVTFMRSRLPQGTRLELWWRGTEGTKFVGKLMFMRIRIQRIRKVESALQPRLQSRKRRLLICCGATSRTGVTRSHSAELEDGTGTRWGLLNFDFGEGLAETASSTTGSEGVSLVVEKLGWHCGCSEAGELLQSRAKAVEFGDFLISCHSKGL